MSLRNEKKNTDNINVDPSTSNHRSPKKAGSRSSTNVKKYSAGTNEVVGPPQKKTGCCKIMWFSDISLNPNSKKLVTLSGWCCNYPVEDHPENQIDLYSEGGKLTLKKNYTVNLHKLNLVNIKPSLSYCQLEFPICCERAWQFIGVVFNHTHKDWLGRQWSNNENVTVILTKVIPS